jgi:hypothetical protein
MKMEIWLSAAMALRRGEITTPGNMVYNSRGFLRHGAIGSADGMAIFPDESTGRQALIALLKTADYQKLSVSDLPEKYDKHNATEYRRMLLSISKLDPNKLIKHFLLKNLKDYARLLNASKDGKKISFQNGHFRST